MEKHDQIVAIIFSKDRAMQLDACLNSFSLQCKDVRNCCRRVIYTCSNERHEMQYKTLTEVHKEVKFFRERSFRQDLIQSMDGFPYVLFLVDDNIFVRSWFIGEVLEALQQNNRSIGFSLRLGRNTTFCYTYNTQQNLPNFEKFSPRILKFKWSKGCEYDFNYPFDVSSSIFRTSEVLPIIRQSSEINNPNELEIVLDKTKNTFYKSHSELFCFETSVAFCNPANMVQFSCLNRFKTEFSSSTYSLSRNFDLGYRVDLSSFIDFIPNACHIEVEFEFMRPDSAYRTLTATVDLKSDYLTNVDKKQTGIKPESRRDFSSSCTLEMSCLDTQKLKLVLEFIDLLRTSNSSSEKVPWLIHVLLRMEVEKRENLSEAYRIIKIYQDRLSEVENLYQEKEKAKKYLEDQWKKWELIAQEQKQLFDILQQKHQNTKESLQSTKEELQSIEQGYQSELSQIINSRTFRLATIFRDARHSKRLFFLFPLRFIYFFLPVRFKGLIKEFSSRIQQSVCIIKEKIRHFPWPKGKPLVSVVIPCYNYGQYVEEAIDSVLSQTWQDFEIIVVDDGSDDCETLKVLDGLRNSKTRVIRQKNLKLPAARNRGIRAARGKYVCCLDADDKIAPTYLEKCLYRLEIEDLDVCGCWQQNFENDNATLVPGNFSVKALLEHNRMINAALFRRSLWRKIGGYDEKMTDGYEDWEFWIRMAAAGAKAVVISEPLFFYRKHGLSMIDTTLEKHDSIVQQIRSKHSKLFDKYESHDHLNDTYHGQPKNGSRNLYRFQKKENDQINILIALPYLTIGGAERVISQICSYLSEREFNITVLTTVPAASELGDTTSWFQGATYGIYHLPRFLPEVHWKDFIFYLFTTRNIQILWQVGSSFVYEMLPEIKTFFSSVKVIDLLFNEVGHGFNNREYDYCIDLTIVENRRVESWLLAQGESYDRIKIIENGVDLKKYRPCPKTEVQNKITSDPRRFIVGFLGRFSEEKGVDIFVEIASRLKDRHDIHFVMAGDGPLRDEINQKIEAHQLREQVQLIGIVDVSEQVPLCDIVVVPSRLDGRPNIVLESLAMGIPVVASRVGGLEEIVDKGRTGFLYNPDEVESFVQGIINILDDAALREKMKLNARKTAEKRFGIQKMFNSYAVMFRTLAGRHSRLEP